MRLPLQELLGGWLRSGDARPPTPTPPSHSSALLSSSSRPRLLTQVAIEDRYVTSNITGVPTFILHDIAQASGRNQRACRGAP